MAVEPQSQTPSVILLRPKEAAQALALSPRKLWSLTACGAVPCVRIDRSVRYDPNDLRVWIESKKGRAGR